MRNTKEKLFLSARWENLCLITYKVSQEILYSYIPSGLTADTIDGSAFMSLVAFDFVNTKVKGIKYPFHVNFPEINLRFYVRSKKKRGVVFIREFVPRHFISLFANKLYNENYKSIKMKSKTIVNGERKVRHDIKIKGVEFSVELIAENKPYIASDVSLENFFKEHEWGFGKSKRGDTLIYRVEHPRWDTFPVKNYSLNFDFGKIYGARWEFLNTQKPYNITLAAGSEIKVFSPQKLMSGT
jgi:uncharacterized protein